MSIVPVEKMVVDNICFKKLVNKYELMPSNHEFEYGKNYLQENIWHAQQMTGNKAVAPSPRGLYTGC